MAAAAGGGLGGVAAGAAPLAVAGAPAPSGAAGGVSAGPDVLTAALDGETLPGATAAPGAVPGGPRPCDARAAMPPAAAAGAGLAQVPAVATLAGAAAALVGVTQSDYVDWPVRGPRSERWLCWFPLAYGGAHSHAITAGRWWTSSSLMTRLHVPLIGLAVCWGPWRATSSPTPRSPGRKSVRRCRRSLPGLAIVIV